MTNGSVRLLITLVLIGWAATKPVVSHATPDSQPQLWTFDADAPGTLPSDFVVGTLFDGRPAGEWRVVQDGPSNVLAQLMGKGAEHESQSVRAEYSDLSGGERCPTDDPEFRSHH